MRLLNFFHRTIWSTVCLALVIAVGFWRLPLSIAAAEPSFANTSTTTYTVNEQGKTNVVHTFKVTNKTPTTYLKQYSITLQFPSLTDISATTQSKPIEPAVSKEGQKTTIALDFDESVVGEGQTRAFTIAYQTPDIANVSGNVLEVRVPPVKQEDQTSQQVIVITPTTFGQPVRTSPKPAKSSIAKNGFEFVFNNQLNEGISLLFGDKQTYKLQSAYELANPGSGMAFTEVALPMDTSYQRVDITKLDPQPEAIKADGDGNWIATYFLEPNAKLKVVIEAIIELTLDRNPEYPARQPNPGHTSSLPHWEFPNAQLSALINQPATAHSVYKNVIDKLSYDQSRTNSQELQKRYGVVQALENPAAAVCQEYADVTVAGFRSLGIPARRINGYAYAPSSSLRPVSQDGTALHTWVEWYDQETKRWRQADPTWEDTTGGTDYFNDFDLNHLALSTYGLSSSQPAPVGSYTDQPQVNITVEVLPTTPLTPPNFSATLTPTRIGLIPIPGSYQLKITNLTGRAWYNTAITATAAAPTQVGYQPLTTDVLPFQEKVIPISLTTDWLAGLQPTTVTVIITVPYATQNDQPPTISANSAPPVFKIVSTLQPQQIELGLGIISLLGLLVTGSLLVFKRRRRPAVRRQSQKPQETAEPIPPTPSP